MDTVLEFVDRDRARTGDVPLLIFQRRGHVEHHQSRFVQPGQQFVRRYWLHRGTFGQVGIYDTFDLCQLALGKLPDHPDEAKHSGIGQTVIHPETLFAGDYEMSITQGLQVLRGIGDRQPGFSGQILNAAFTLRQHVHQFQPVRVRNSPDNAGKLLVISDLNAR